MSSVRGTWGYTPLNTSAYAWGVASLFPSDCFGNDVTNAHCPLPIGEPQVSGMSTGKCNKKQTNDVPRKAFFSALSSDRTVYFFVKCQNFDLWLCWYCFFYLSIDTINRAAAMFNQSFSFADLLHVQTCVGAEGNSKQISIETSTYIKMKNKEVVYLLSSM